MDVATNPPLRCPAGTPCRPCGGRTPGFTAARCGTGWARSCSGDRRSKSHVRVPGTTPDVTWRERVGGAGPSPPSAAGAESPSRILWETTTAQVGGPSVRLAGAAAPRVTKGWRGQCRCPRSAERGPGTRRLLRHELLAAPSPFPTESDVRNVNQTPSICSRSSPTTVCADTLSLHSKKDVGGDIPDGIQAAEVQFTLCWADPLWGLRQLPRGRDTASQCSVWGHGTGMLAQAGRSMRV